MCRHCESASDSCRQVCHLVQYPFPKERAVQVVVYCHRLSDYPTRTRCSPRRGIQEYFDNYYLQDITLGNHAFGSRDLYSFLDDRPTEIIRPANYPAACPGVGYAIRRVNGLRLLCMNLSGTAFLDPLDNPFTAADRILERERGGYDIALLDFHAEATSEKLAMGYHLDGRAQIIFGTHTHVPTADARILPKGSGYITDLGMTGPQNGILGTDAEAVLRKMRTHLPSRFTVADGPITAQGAVFTLEDSKPYRCVRVERVEF